MALGSELAWVAGALGLEVALEAEELAREAEALAPVLGLAVPVRRRWASRIRSESPFHRSRGRLIRGEVYEIYNEPKLKNISTHLVLHARNERREIGCSPGVGGIGRSGIGMSIMSGKREEGCEMKDVFNYPIYPLMLMGLANATKNTYV